MQYWPSGQDPYTDPSHSGSVGGVGEGVGGEEEDEEVGKGVGVDDGDGSDTVS